MVKQRSMPVRWAGGPGWRPSDAAGCRAPLLGGLGAESDVASVRGQGRVRRSRAAPARQGPSRRRQVSCCCAEHRSAVASSLICAGLTDQRGRLRVRVPDAATLRRPATCQPCMDIVAPQAHASRQYEARRGGASSDQQVRDLVVIVGKAGCLDIPQLSAPITLDMSLIDSNEG